MDRVQPVPDMFAESRLFAAARVAVAVQVKLVQIEEQQVEGARPEEQLVGEVVLVLPSKVPDAARELKVPLGECGCGGGQHVLPVRAQPPLVDIDVDALGAFCLGLGVGAASAKRVEEGGFAGLSEADEDDAEGVVGFARAKGCLLYTSDAADE